MASPRLFQSTVYSMEAKVMSLTSVGKDCYVCQTILTFGPDCTRSLDRAKLVYCLLDANLFSELHVNDPFIIKINVVETTENKQVKHEFLKLQEFCDYLKSKNIDLKFLDQYANLKKYLTMEPGLPNFKNSASEPHIYNIDPPSNLVLIYSQMRR